MRHSRLYTKEELIENFLCAEGEDQDDDAAEEGSGTSKHERAMARLLYRVVASPTEQALDRLRRGIGSYGGSRELAELGISLPEWKAEQLAAIDAIKELFDLASSLGVPGDRMTESYAEILQSSVLRIRCSTFKRGPRKAPDVLVTTLDDAAAPRMTRPASLFVCDADAASYPAAKRDDACSRLFFEGLGLSRGESRLSQLRRTWNHLVSQPTDSLFVLRNLNDFDGNPTYPCSMVEEFVDCYRDLSTDEARTGRDLDKTYLLPECLRAKVETLGEQNLPQDVLAGVDPPASVVHPASEWDPEDRTWILPRKDHGPELSPTEIDDYRACPYHWFISRRLSSHDLDRDFSPLERGMMLHDIFDRFYERMREAELYTVRGETLERAHGLMDELFDDELAKRLDGGVSGEDVAFTPLAGTTEEAELRALRPQVHQWVDAQAELTAMENDVGGETFSFVPKAFEFDLKGFGVDYAGVRLNGRVDRIDVDWQRKMATVIDYKGSMTKSDYEPEVGKGKIAKPKAKLQALVYASAIQSSPEIRRELGLRESEDGHYVRGVIYSSYRKGFAKAGTLIEDASEASKETFDENLAVVEEAVRQGVVEPMRAGEVPRSPIDKKACRYCPVLGCPKRL